MADLGFVILDDVSGWTVSRSEVKCGATLIASSRLWFSMMQQDLFTLMPSGYSTSLIATRQDATHGRKKVACLELSAAYLAGCDLECDSHNWESFHRIKRLGDVLRIRDETAHGTMGFTKKVLEGLGAPTWESWSSGPYASGGQLLGCIQAGLYKTAPPLPLYCLRVEKPGPQAFLNQCKISCREGPGLGNLREAGGRYNEILGASASPPCLVIGPLSPPEIPQSSNWFHIPPSCLG